MCREILDNLLSGTKAGFKATRNLVFNQKAERSTMNRQKSREIVENVLSGMKAGFKSILNFEHPFEREKMFNQKSSSKLSATLLALILGASVLWVSPAVAAEKEMVRDPATGKMVTAPEYGGTLTFPSKNELLDQDPSIGGYWAQYQISGVQEKLAIVDWALPRDVFAMNTFLSPPEHFIGWLAESWSSPDLQTFIVKVRQGVRWHDKAPVNGRELTAEDVAWTYRRIGGLLDWKPEFNFSLRNFPWESIEATDRYTVVFKLTEPRLDLQDTVLADDGAWILPPEVIEQHGNYSDWRNVVGTGAYQLDDFQPGVRKRWVRNPDYWGFDEKYPDNRLPYVDEMVSLFMQEEATYTAALRTGQVDMLTIGGGITLSTFEAVNAVQKTNPEIQAFPLFARANQVSGMNIRRPPFDDIRVRKAMNMAIDRDAINESYYGGYAYPTVDGFVGTGMGSLHTPFEEWPADLQAEYSYNPQEAERLLDEAGLPRGADGVRLRVTYDHRDVIDLGWVEIVAGYWKEIGVEVEINVMDTGNWVDRGSRGLYEMRTGDSGWEQTPAQNMNFYGALYNYEGEGQPNQMVEYVGGVRDATLDRIFEAYLAATSKEDHIPIFKEYNEYIMRQHFQVYGHKAPLFQLAHPWVKGFNGETQLSSSDALLYLTRIWLDQDLKREMGY